MNTKRHIDHLMQQLGPLVDEIVAIRQVEQSVWALAVAPDSALIVVENQTAHKLTFRITIGPVPASRRSAVYETVLLANSLWSESGGVCLALDEPDGNIEMICDLFQLDLDLATFVTVVTNILAKAKAWRKTLSKLAAGPTAASASDVPQDALRV